MDLIYKLEVENYDQWLRDCAQSAESDKGKICLPIGDIPFPNKTEPGSKVFILYEGFIRGYFIITEFDTKVNAFKDLVTGREYNPGNFIVCRGEFFMVPQIKRIQDKPYTYFNEKISKEFEIEEMPPEIEGHHPFIIGDIIIGEVVSENVVDFWSKNIFDKFQELNENEGH